MIVLLSLFKHISYKPYSVCITRYISRLESGPRRIGAVKNKVVTNNDDIFHENIEMDTHSDTDV